MSTLEHNDTGTAAQASRAPSTLPPVRVETTAGDFPHARRSRVRLACCTCTCCCFTFLGGGLGGIVGLVSGIVAGVRSDAPRTASPVLALLGTVGWFLLLTAGYTVAGLLIGAAIGFCIDILFVFR